MPLHLSQLVIVAVLWKIPSNWPSIATGSLQSNICYLLLYQQLKAMIATFFQIFNLISCSITPPKPPVEGTLTTDDVSASEEKGMSIPVIGSSTFYLIFVQISGEHCWNFTTNICLFFLDPHSCCTILVFSHVSVNYVILTGSAARQPCRFPCRGSN